MKARSLCIVLIDTGMRIGEALNLQWQMVDFQKRRIEVYRSKTDSWSYLPLTERAAKELMKYHNQRQPFMSMDRAKKVLRKVINRVCNVNETIIKQAGRATIHSLRDTFASRLIQRGFTLKELKDMMGHTTLSMADKYGHLETQDVGDKAARIMAEIASERDVSQNGTSAEDPVVPE